MGRRLLVVAFAAVLAAMISLSGAEGAARSGAPTITTHAPYPVVPWTPATDNLIEAGGRLTVGGKPVSGVRLKVGGYALPNATDADGRFGYLLDDTIIGRHTIAVLDATHATIGGAPLTAAQQKALASTAGAITVAYPLVDVHASRNAAGNLVISGRFAFAGLVPPLVSLYSYQLVGTVLDANGRPVAGARVSTRTVDRDYWTVSSPTDRHGQFSSLFTASSETGTNPVPMTVRVSKGDLVYQFLSEEYVNFQLLKSARIVLRLPPPGYPVVLPLPQTYPGAIYEGLVVGAAVGGRPVRPLSATWPDAHGRFTLTLPRSFRGRTVSLWEATLDLFSRARAAPGGPIDVSSWPAALPQDAPRGLAAVALP